MNLEELKYPIGPFRFPKEVSDEELKGFIKDIEDFPELLKKQVSELNKDKLSWPYRPGGWSIREVIHHCTDSHINSMLRFKKTLTEDEPSIPPYQEALWAELADDQESSVDNSLMLLEALHHKWVILLKSLDASQLKRAFVHEEYQKKFNLEQMAALYSWHCRHHLAHVIQAIESNGAYLEKS